MDHTLDYIKYILTLNHEHTHLTPLEQGINTIYTNNTYELFMNNNGNFMVDVDKIKNETLKLLTNNVVIKLLFTNGRFIYVTKDYLIKTTFFNNMINDVANNDMFVEIPLFDKLDNYEHMIIVIKYLKHNIISESMFINGLNILCDIIDILDYLQLPNITEFIDIFVHKHGSFTNVTLELLEYMHNIITKNNYNIKIYTRYSIDDVFVNLFVNNENELVNNDNIKEMSFFKTYIANYDDGKYVIKYNCHDLFVMVCNDINYHTLLNNLIKNKPINCWQIIKQIYKKMQHKKFHIDIWLATNKHLIDITFFDVTIDYYDIDLVLWLIDKYKCYDKLDLYTHRPNYVETKIINFQMDHGILFIKK